MKVTQKMCCFMFITKFFRQKGNSDIINKKDTNHTSLTILHTGFICKYPFLILLKDLERKNLSKESCLKLVLKKGNFVHRDNQKTK
jgi:hypothetical protein